jgi:hypothetical protein
VASGRCLGTTILGGSCDDDSDVDVRRRTGLSTSMISVRHLAFNSCRTIGGIGFEADEGEPPQSDVIASFI